jgi:integrase
MPHTKVAVYRRDSTGYHKCVPQGVYPANKTQFHLRYEIQKGRRTYERLPDGTDYKRAVRTALQKEISLDEVPSLPFKTKPLPKPAASPGLTPISAAVEAYLDGLWAEGNLRAKTIKGKKFELTRWIGWCAKRHVEELDRSDLIAFRNRLIAEGFASWTVESNMMTVTTMLKHNPLRSIAGLLKPQDWVEIVDSEPDPYTLEEVQALLRVGNEDERLLVRFLVGTGCRDQEVAHLRWEDIDWNQKTIWIHAKKCDCAECAKDKGLWKPKSKAGTRTIPISDSLIRDLKKRRKRDGLVFPAPEGGVERHFYRIVENLAEMAGVEKPGVHKFRDTWATDLLRDSSVDIFTLRRWIGHQNLETLRLYAESLKAKDQRARNAANGQDKYLIADAAD